MAAIITNWEPLCQKCLIMWAGNYCTVSCIGGCQSDNIEIWLESGDKVWVDREDCDPIEVTEEFLEKHEFTKEIDTITGDPLWYSKNRRLQISKFSNTVGRDWSLHIDNEDFETIGSGDFQYVHQLQILIWGSGIDDFGWWIN